MKTIERKLKILASKIKEYRKRSKLPPEETEKILSLYEKYSLENFELSEKRLRGDSRKNRIPKYFKGLDFRLASFCGMDLRDIVFECCDLSWTDFRNANLENALFIRCDIRGADFSSANMTNVHMPGSVYISEPIKSEQEKTEQDLAAYKILGWTPEDLVTGEMNQLKSV